MKKHFRVSTALLAAVLLAGCGSISSKDGGYYATESPSAEGAYDTAAGAANSSIVPEELPDSTDETAQKIIYNADINMESTDFDAARDTLLAAVDDCGAWMEYSSLSGDAKDHDRYAYYTVRVPVENYRTFLAAVGEAGSVLDLSETAENITSSYIDVQARLSALEARRPAGDREPAFRRAVPAGKLHPAAEKHGPAGQLFHRGHPLKRGCHPDPHRHHLW